MHRQEATTESKKAKIIRFSKRIGIDAGLSEHWGMIQGLYVDDSVGDDKSTNRVTELAISHPPQAWCNPELFQLKRAFST